MLARHGLMNFKDEFWHTLQVAANVAGRCEELLTRFHLRFGSWGLGSTGVMPAGWSQETGRGGGGGIGISGGARAQESPPRGA